MKNVLATVFLMSAIVLSSTAQERRGNTPRSVEDIATQRTKHLTEQLNLTETQQEAVYNLQLEEANRQQERFAERRAAAEQARKARGEAIKQHQERRSAVQQQLDEILTTEQRELLVAKREEQREAMKEMRKKQGENRGKFDRGDRNKPRDDRKGQRPSRGSES